MRAGLEALLKVVAHHDERAAFAQTVEQRVEDFDRMGVEARVRLVEKHHVGIVDQGAGDREALRHAARERTHHVEAAMVQFDRAQQLAHALFGIADAVKARDEHEVFHGCEIRIEHGVVRDEPDVLAHLIGVFLRIGAHDADGARRGPGQG